jgi:UDP-glucose 4-epimerase
VYGASKAAAEMYLGAVDPRAVEVVILRLANVYGPGDRDRVIPTFAASALQGGPLVLYGSDKELDFVWIGDVVEVLTKAGFSSAPVLEPTNVGSGSAISLRSLAERILRLVGNSAGIQVVPARGPEVERFQADIRRAVRYFGLRAQEDPLSHLPEVLTYGPLVNRST